MAQAWSVEECKYKLLLPPQDQSFTSQVYASVAVFGEKREVRYEPAGKAFHALQRRASGLTWELEKKGKKAQAPVKTEPIARTGTPHSANGDSDDGDVLMQGLKEEQDYYALLGIGHLGLNASDKQIKKAYQEMILKTHPDKIRADATKEEIASANALFRDVQKAYEILSDTEKRRGYDSQFDFDDKIPSGLETIRDDNAFFNLYGPVFEMNARFSVQKPVPMLGGSEDDEATVKAFYNFWKTFRSWRDFSAYDEHKDGDLETAESRDHRRWMMKKNEANREKLRKKEFARIQTLVERAYKNDPRIARFKAEAERQKLEAIKAKEAAKKAIEDAKREEEERKERERLEAERIQAEKRESEKKAKADAKSARKKSLKALQAALTKLNFDEVAFAKEFEALTLLDPEAMRKAEEMVTAANSVEPFLEMCRAKIYESSAAAREEEERKQKAAQELAAQEAREKAEEKAKKALVWTPEALSYLAKGMAKHPGGTRNRWQCIATFVGTCGFQASESDCIEASKKLTATGPNKPAVLVTGATPASGATPIQPENAPPAVNETKAAETISTKEWTSEEQKTLEAALREFPNTMEINERWTAIAGRVGTRNKKECAARVKELRAKAMEAKQQQ